MVGCWYMGRLVAGGQGLVRLPNPTRLGQSMNIFINSSDCFFHLRVRKEHPGWMSTVKFAEDGKRWFFENSETFQSATATATTIQCSTWRVMKREQPKKKIRIVQSILNTLWRNLEWYCYCFYNYSKGSLPIKIVTIFWVDPHISRRVFVIFLPARKIGALVHPLSPHMSPNLEWKS